MLETVRRPLKFMLAPNKELRKPYQQESQGGQNLFWLMGLRIITKKGLLFLNQDDDECNLIEYSNCNHDKFCVHSAKHNNFFEEFRSERERMELGKKIFRHVTVDN